MDRCQCCPDKPLVKDFLSLIDSFNLEQCVSGPTHEHGHSLDLVLCHGLSVSNMEICDNVFSDHLPVLFEAAVSCAAVKSAAPARCHRIFNPVTAGQFSAAFNQLCVPSDLTYANMEMLSSWFHFSCRTILDFVGPFKMVQPKAKPESWFNGTTRAARQECHKAECRWKKDKLQVSRKILKDCWRCYQSTVKEARIEHLSNIIESNSHNPRVLLLPSNLFLAHQSLRAQRNPLKCAIASCLSSLIRLLLQGLSSPHLHLTPLTMFFAQLCLICLSLCL